MASPFSYDYDYDYVRCTVYAPRRDEELGDGVVEVFVRSELCLHVLFVCVPALLRVAMTGHEYVTRTCPMR